VLWIILFALLLGGIRYLIRREVAKGDAAGLPGPPPQPKKSGKNQKAAEGGGAPRGGAPHA
jgi:hypothetical protein